MKFTPRPPPMFEKKKMKPFERSTLQLMGVINPNKKKIP